MTASPASGSPRLGLGALLMLMGAGAQALSYSAGPNLGSRYYITWLLMVSGLILLVRGAAGRVREKRVAAGLLPALAVVAVCAGMLWFARSVASPADGAEQAVDEGERAAQELKSIIEPQLDLLESDAAGPEMLASWKESAERAVSLKPRFTAAVEASRLLAGQSEGDRKRHHEIDVQYFGLCADWVDLYQEIHITFTQESIAEPPPEWTLRFTEIVEKIQALPPDPLAGP